MVPQVTNIFEFSDFRKFLAEYQRIRQAEDKTYTRSRVCRELGLPNSRSYFNDVVKGLKPLTKNAVERFILALRMDPDEARYFRVLVDFNQSVQPAEREMLFDQLVALNRTPYLSVSATPALMPSPSSVISSIAWSRSASGGSHTDTSTCTRGLMIVWFSMELAASRSLGTIKRRPSSRRM
jgi:hypothetical protein